MVITDTTPAWMDRLGHAIGHALLGLLRMLYWLAEVFVDGIRALHRLAPILGIISILVVD